MAAPQVPLTLTYKRDGTKPPIFIAGSFSSPPWEPLEMDVTTDHQGLNFFTKQVMVQPDTDILYKFRIGHGDWWGVDDSRNTVMDGLGNLNNQLRSPHADTTDFDQRPTHSRIYQLKDCQPQSGQRTPDHANVAAEVADSAALLDPATPEPRVPNKLSGELGLRRLSTTPINEVSSTAAEVAGTASMLDVDSDALEAQRGRYDDEAVSPLFPHESLQPSDNTEQQKEATSNVEEPASRSFAPHGIPEPHPEHRSTVEKFPSDRKSILETVRRLSTAVGEDQDAAEGVDPTTDLSAQSGPSAHETLDGAGSKASLASIDETEERSPPDSAIHATEGLKTGTAASDHARRMSTALKIKPNIEDEGIAMGFANPKNGPEAEEGDDSMWLTPDSAHSPKIECHIVERAPDKSLPLPPEDLADMDEGAMPSTLSINHAGISSPRIVVSPATDGNETTQDYFALETNSNQDLQPAQTAQPNQRRAKAIDRPSTPASIHSIRPQRKEGNWLHLFLRVVFIDWIGGFLSSLCGTRRSQD